MIHKQFALFNCLFSFTKDIESERWEQNTNYEFPTANKDKYIFKGWFVSEIDGVSIKDDDIVKSSNYFARFECVSHVYLDDSWVIEQEADCINNGSRSQECENCLYGRKSEIIEAIGHDWDGGSQIKKPTCTEIGETLYTCKNNLSHTKKEDISILGHNYNNQFTIDKIATCTTYGSQSKHCERFDTCGDKIEVQRIAKSAHAFGDWIVTLKPNCTIKGKMVQCCSACDIELIQEIAIILDAHNWNEVGKITQQATVNENGKITYTCKNNERHKVVKELKFEFKANEDTTLKSEVEEIIKNNYKEFKLIGIYDLASILENIEILPGEKFSVRMALPYEFRDVKSIEILIKTDEGWQETQSGVKDGYIIFYADKLTSFAIIGKVVDENVAENINVFLKFLWLWIGLIILIIAAAFCCWYFITFEITFIIGNEENIFRKKCRAFVKVKVTDLSNYQKIAVTWYFDKELTIPLKDFNMPLHKVSLYSNIQNEIN